MWGRSVFDNIRRFIQFQLTVNIVALIVAFIGAVTKYGTPLTAVQLLWINLIMDTLAALALGTEKPTSELLHRKPHGRKGRMITWTMWRNIIIQAIYQITILCLLLFAVDYSAGRHIFLPIPVSPNDSEKASIHYTIIFNTFVFCQIFNEINCRKLGSNEYNILAGISNNLVFCSILVLESAVQALIVQFGGIWTQTVGLSAIEWGICLGFAFVTLIIGFVSRLIPVPLESWEKPVY